MLGFFTTSSSGSLEMDTRDGRAGLFGGLLGGDDDDDDDDDDGVDDDDV